MRIRAQLRLTFACRRKTNTEEPNSVERPVYRRKAPAPIRVSLAGAGARWRSCLPTSHRSPEDGILSRAQLRLTFACRRKTNTEERNSVERGAPRRKAPAPARGCFAGVGVMFACCPPTSLRSSEDSIRPRAQLRLTFACRSKTDTEESNSVEKGAHRRKAPAPVRVCFAGAGKSAEFVPPTRDCSPEDRVRIRAQLRLTFACMRKTNTE